MSYIRFGEDGSDVYVFENTDDKLECCGCIFDGPCVRTSDVEEFLRHLAEHRTAGHHVPADVDVAIRDAYPDGTVQ